MFHKSESIRNSSVEATNGGHGGDFMTKSLVIEYRRMGGLVGFNDKLEIYDDGSVEVSGHGIRTKDRISDEKLEGLLQLFVDNDFFTMEDSYGPKSGCDLMTYDISYNHDGNSKRVTVSAEGEVPEGFRVITQELQKIMYDLRKKTA